MKDNGRELASTQCVRGASSTEIIASQPLYGYTPRLMPMQSQPVTMPRSAAWP
jgi:hypothetical protein